jgi:hypothetical protein
MVDADFAPELVTITDGRITIPRPYCPAIRWATGDQPIRVWLLELMAGRFRLLSDQEVEQDQKLSDVRRALVEGPPETKPPPTQFEPNDIAFLVARLIPTVLSTRPTCRLAIPKRIAPENTNKLFLLFSMGYLEIWRLDLYNRASATSLDSII